MMQRFNFVWIFDDAMYPCGKTAQVRKIYAPCRLAARTPSFSMQGLLRGSWKRLRSFPQLAPRHIYHSNLRSRKGYDSNSPASIATESSWLSVSGLSAARLSFQVRQIFPSSNRAE